MTARDGLEAVEIFHKHGDEIACVLMDLQMPRMDGIEAYRQIRKIDENVQVVIASGFLNDTYRQLPGAAVRWRNGGCERGGRRGFPFKEIIPGALANRGKGHLLVLGFGHDDCRDCGVPPMKSQKGVDIEACPEGIDR